VGFGIVVFALEASLEEYAMKTQNNVCFLSFLSRGSVEIRIRTRGFLRNDSQSRLPAPAFSRLYDISITHLDVIGLVGLWYAFRLRKRQINRVMILSERPLKLTSECEESNSLESLGIHVQPRQPRAVFSRRINSPNNDFNLGKTFRRCPLLDAM